MRGVLAGPDRVRSLFDFVDPAQIAGQPPQTVVPTQALFLFNNDLLRKRDDAVPAWRPTGGAPRSAAPQTRWDEYLAVTVATAEVLDALEVRWSLGGPPADVSTGATPGP